MPSAGALLPASFYDRDTELVARDLLGAVLRCVTPQGVASGRIVETEAYLGEHDAACHAAAGRTARTEILYGEPGTAYVYFTYGMHWCANAVTRRAGLPSAVLIRAIEPMEGLALMRRRRPAADGDPRTGQRRPSSAPPSASPATLNGVAEAFAPHDPRRHARAGGDVAITPRIGITKAIDWPLRWVVASSPHLSKRYRTLPSPAPGVHSAR